MQNKKIFLSILLKLSISLSVINPTSIPPVRLRRIDLTSIPTSSGLRLLRISRRTYAKDFPSSVLIRIVSNVVVALGIDFAIIESLASLFNLFYCCVFAFFQSWLGRLVMILRNSSWCVLDNISTQFPPNLLSVASSLA